MAKKVHHMDMSFLDGYDGSTVHYEPHNMLATPTGKPLMVFVSKNADPARWSIVGNNTFSVHFLHYRDMVDYIKQNKLVVWNEEHDAKYQMKLSIHNRKRPTMIW